MNSSEYVNQERRDYSLYVLQMRAIPHAADGLKAGARRVLWIARNGKEYKSATLAGATMPIHPHQAPYGAINTLAAPYGNNIPLLWSDCAFGTLLNPTAYGAERYTDVKVSEFCKDVVFRDIEIIPMKDNYDGTIEEPRHFLPLVPIVLLNPQSGIAVGFASDILPRDLAAIVTDQIAHLNGDKVPDRMPAFTPTNQVAQEWDTDADGKICRFDFYGSLKKLNATTVQITNLPYGLTHEKYIDKLTKWADAGRIYFDPQSDDNSRDKYDITVKFKKGFLRGKAEGEILQYLGLINRESENMNVVDFDGQNVWSTTYSELIQVFTDWRLGFYKIRYQRLANLLAIEISKYRDILIAIRRNVGNTAKRVRNRSELKDFLKEIGITNIDYIADLPVYRFTVEEKEKTEKKLAEAEAQMKEYQALLKSEEKRRKVYVEELAEVLNRYQAGKYTSK